MVLPDRIELSTSPLPRECSTTELRQHGVKKRIGPGKPPQAAVLATSPPLAQALAQAGPSEVRPGFPPFPRPRFDRAEAGGEGRIARYLAENCLADFSDDGSKAQGRRQEFAAGSAEGGAARKSQAQKVARKGPGGDHAVVQSG